MSTCCRTSASTSSASTSNSTSSTALQSMQTTVQATQHVATLLRSVQPSVHACKHVCCACVSSACSLAPSEQCMCKHKQSTHSSLLGRAPYKETSKNKHEHMLSNKRKHL